MPVQVQIIYPDGPMDIQEDATVIVPAGDLAVVVTGAPDAPIRFDGRIQPFFPTGPDSKMAPLKLARSTGFHHLSIPPGHDFWLGTEDAKLQLDGIEEMLLYLPSEGLDWSGQFLFSDGSYYRDPHVTYGWLDQHADHLLTAAELIVVRPQRSEAPTTRMTARGGKRLDLQATASLLRRRGATLLDQTVNGPVVVDGRGYTPRCVIARMHHEALDNAANRKVVWLVAQIETLIAEVHKEVRRERKDLEMHRCAEWADRAARILRASTFASLYEKSLTQPPSPAPSIEETVDERYAAIGAGVRDLSYRTGWAAQRERRPLYSYVKYSDQIYQAFVAYAAARALDLRPTASVLGGTSPAFVGDDWEMYYNVVPPAHVMRSWRSYTADEDASRPDILFRSLRDGTVVLADAKYRNKGARADESSRREVSAYMSMYALDRAIILYPPDPKDALGVHPIVAADREIVEVTVSPVAGLQAWLRTELPPILNRIKTAPVWRGDGP